LEPLAPFPLPSPARFSRSIQEPSTTPATPPTFGTTPQISVLTA
jgi:hypothetical protein